MNSIQAYDADYAPWHTGLSVRLFAMTFATILFLELLIFLPSASDFRRTWLLDQGEHARLLAMALDAAPARAVSKELGNALLESADLLSVGETEEYRKTLLLAPATPLTGDFYATDLTVRSPVRDLVDTMKLLGASGDGFLIVTVDGSQPDRTLEYIVPEKPLRDALRGYASRIGGLSLLIGLVSSTLIYFVLHRFVVFPIKRITRSVERFAHDPGGWTQRLPPTKRRDELGRAQNALTEMEAAVAESFRQRAHLAELGTAVAKINHDLRNSLAAAQIVSESLTQSNDPRVAKAAARIERALERAINLTNDTLEYGKATPQAATFVQLGLTIAAKEATEEALAAFPDVTYKIDIPTDLYVRADHDHLHRMLVNLIKNAAQAMADSPEKNSITLTARTNTLRISDTGPGIPDRTQANLFKPFTTGQKAGGSGLGLVIAKELAEGMGWTLELESTGTTGTVFRIGFNSA